MKKLAIVIPTHKNIFLKDVLMSLVNNYGYDPNVVEIIVVENPEITDKTKAELKEINPNGLYDIKLIQSEIGANKARNVGVRYSNSEIVALIDDDCVTDRHFIHGVISAHQIYPRVGVIGGCIKLTFRCTKPRWLEGAFMSALACIDQGEVVIDYSKVSDRYGSIIASGNISFKRHIYDKTDGFDEGVGYVGKDSLMAYDEIMFINQCMEVCSGTPSRLYIGNIIVYHFIPENRTTLSYFIKKSYGDGYNFMKVAHHDPQNKGYNYEDFIVNHVLHRWEFLLTIHELAKIRAYICHEESTRIYISNVMRCKIAFYQGAFDYLDQSGISRYSNDVKLLSAMSGI